MKIPSILLRHPALAWLVPSAAVIVLGSVAMGAFTSSSSTASLPETNPRALLAAVSTAAQDPARGYSGTIVVDTSLGLTDSEDAGTAAAPATFTAMLSGPHTLRYWYGGPQRQRVALLRPTSEADFFHNGEDLWEWDSASQVLTHAHASVAAGWTLPMTFAALTPQQLTARALAAVDRSTTVSLGPDQRIADRPCYELVITPGQGGTRIGSIRIWVDGATEVPLSVQIYARGAGDQPSVDATFSTVTFKHPADSYFTFAPPGVASPSAAKAPGADLSGSATTGAGFATVVEYRGSVAELGSGAEAMLKPVNGAWGSGKLLESPLVCLLALTDGRVYLGSVDPGTLYEAASK